MSSSLPAAATAASGEDGKDLRMQAAAASSLGYNANSLLENPVSPTAEKPRGSDPNSGGGSKSKPRISYRECLKNHAANIGGHVTDGCGEFMPSGEEGTIEALKCAACNCHRNFHRKEHHGESAAVHPLQLPPPLPSPSMSQHRSAHWGPMVHPMKMAFAGGGGGGGTDSSSEELNFNAFHSSAAPPPPPPPPQFAAKKRFRTKFTTEQKERMLEFAEKLGWRIPREDDSEVQRFCAEVGVKRQVFKVWMHNNKNSSSSSSSKKNPQLLM
ncbi:zinc-finger homeodomain protein 5 [Andrographis paniculata]|uniref:zinc-finger homeodomain protein 5 n=1 Tax=Andrographis paniculata TaxID=175694 RepID=UPI0021E964D0|nr:zinc-finger homeodomain protein 5 [Andrographis paniculata]